MIFLDLFLTFFQIGAVSFGGGYGMISLMREKALGYGLSQEAIMNFIAVSESTPGPIAINMATFIGSSKGGILGSLCATLGIVLPSFIIILLIVSLFKNFTEYKGVKAAISGIKPVVTGLIIATSITMFLSNIFSIKTVDSAFGFDAYGIVIFAVIAVGAYIYKRIKKKVISPILLILISAVFGMILYR